MLLIYYSQSNICALFIFTSLLPYRDLKKIILFINLILYSDVIKKNRKAIPYLFAQYVVSFFEYILQLRLFSPTFLPEIGKQNICGRIRQWIWLRTAIHRQKNGLEGCYITGESDPISRRSIDELRYQRSRAGPEL